MATINPKVTASAKTKSRSVSGNAKNNNSIIATGCPYSGWDVVLPMLKKTGLETDDKLTVWYDELFRTIGINNPLEIHQPLQPDTNLLKRAASPLGRISSSAGLFADSRNLWLLDFWAEFLPNAKFLLFYTDPGTSLAHVLQKQILDPLEFLARWQTANRYLLKFQRHHKKRAIILDSEAAVQRPDTLVNACQDLGINLQITDTSLDAVATPPLLEQLFANYIITRLPDVQTLNRKILTKTYQLDDSEPVQQELQVDEIINIYMQKKSGEKQILDLAKGIKDKDAIINKLNESQKSLEELNEVNNELKKDNDILLLQLHQAQEELEKYFLICQELTKENEKIISQMNQEDTREINVARQLQNETGQNQSIIKKMITIFRDFVGPSVNYRTSDNAILQQIKLLKKSGYFDETWYLFEYPDVARDGIDPVEHYLCHGAGEERNPSTQFNTHFYLQSNPDVANMGMNPLLHYVKYGKMEGRKPVP